MLVSCCSVPWKPTYKAPHYIAATCFLSTTHVLQDNRPHPVWYSILCTVVFPMHTHFSEQRWKVGSDSAMQGGTLAAEGSGSTSVEQCLSAKFHFVDLAGSERAGRTGNQGERFKGQLGHWLLCLWTSGQELVRGWSLKDVSSYVLLLPSLLPLCNIYMHHDLIVIKCLIMNNGRNQSVVDIFLEVQDLLCQLLSCCIMILKEHITQRSSMKLLVLCLMKYELRLWSSHHPIM